MKKKWKNLRDTFNREYKKVPIPKSGDSADSAPVYNGKWPYFQSMLFLKDMAQPRSTSSNLQTVEDSTSSLDDTLLDEGHEETEDNVISESVLANITSDILAPPTPKQRKSDTTVHVAPQTVRPQKNKQKQSSLSTFECELLKKEDLKLELLKDPDDDDLNFFKSLLPYFKTMNPIKKLKLRSKIQDLVIQELDSATPSPMPSPGQSSASHSSSSSYVPSCFNQYNYEYEVNVEQDQQSLTVTDVLVNPFN